MLALVGPKVSGEVGGTIDDITGGVVSVAVLLLVFVVVLDIPSMSFTMLPNGVWR
jgi:hypothetical protein